MVKKDKLKDVAFRYGVDLIGFASIDRFNDSPAGFHPRDIYSKTNTVIVFAIALPSESLYAENPIPYTHLNTLAMNRMNYITFSLSREFENLGVRNVMIPTDDPYLDWNSEKQEGRAILSLRHAGQLAGLGNLGKNNLLINKDFGSMIQIGALLTAEVFESDPLADYEVCPYNCRICLDSCPKNALTGETVIQKECRPVSNHITEKGYTIKQCFECRKRCPSVLGILTKEI